MVQPFGGGHGTARLPIHSWQSSSGLLIALVSHAQQVRRVGVLMEPIEGDAASQAWMTTLRRDLKS